MFELYTSKYYRELVQLGPGQPRRPYIAHMVSWIYSGPEAKEIRTGVTMTYINGPTPRKPREAR